MIFVGKLLLWTVILHRKQQRRLNMSRKIILGGIASLKGSSSLLLLFNFYEKIKQLEAYSLAPEWLQHQYHSSRKALTGAVRGCRLHQLPSAEWQEPLWTGHQSQQTERHSVMHAHIHYYCSFNIRNTANIHVFMDVLEEESDKHKEITQTEGH